MNLHLNFRTEKELLAYARGMKDKRLCDLCGEPLNQKDKGAVAKRIEQLFGIKSNSEPLPDFKRLGIELKVVPLKRLTSRQLKVKERTKICAIDYKKLVSEDWMQSHARTKMKKMLFVFCEYDKANPIYSRIEDCAIFDLTTSDEPLIRSDWERTKCIVKRGEAHLLSEKQNVVLAASRSGAGGQKEADQPVKKHRYIAPERSFSLKSTFTQTIWQEVRGKKKMDRIYDVRNYASYSELESYILEMLNRWTGRSLAEFAVAHSTPILKGKDASAQIVRHALGLKKGSGPIKELLQTGLTVKSIPCRSADSMPFEAMSFPYQLLGEITQEDRFEESVFYAHLQGFILIPLLRDKRNIKDKRQIYFGSSFVWRPSAKELSSIGEEWEMIRDVIRDGVVVETKTAKNRRGYMTTNNIPGAGDMKYIHMRPHGRDSNDTDKSIGGHVTKQCFWLNKSFVQRLILNKGKA